MKLSWKQSNEILNNIVLELRSLNKEMTDVNRGIPIDQTKTERALASLKKLELLYKDASAIAYTLNSGALGAKLIGLSDSIRISAQRAKAEMMLNHPQDAFILAVGSAHHEELIHTTTLLQKTISLRRQYFAL